MGRRRYYSRKPSLQTKRYIKLNAQQKKWVETMMAHEAFTDYLFKNNKLYFYQIRKAHVNGNYSDAPASRRAMHNACKMYKEFCNGMIPV